MKKTPFIIAANWKMYKSPRDAQAFFDEFKSRRPNLVNERLFFFLPAVNLFLGQKNLQDEEIHFGPQNIYFEDEGAYTGETAVTMASDMNCQVALVGHSERRKHFFETNSDCAAKIAAIHRHGLTPIYCIGETLEDRRDQRTLDVLRTQLAEGLTRLDSEKTVHIAYEPIWAIGTGEVASPQQVAEAHQFIREYLHKNVVSAASSAILYGGSVKPGNARELSHVANVDGFLVGSASLKPEIFSEIIEAVQG